MMNDCDRVERCVLDQRCSQWLTCGQIEYDEYDCSITFDHGPEVVGDRIERCRVTRPHAIHESAHGYYRWDDTGTLVPTPHWSTPEFAALYGTALAGEQLHRAALRWAGNQAEVNARLAAAGRCVLHNGGVNQPARFLMELPIGNVLPLCVECHAWWIEDAAVNPDPMIQPVRITKC